MKCRLCKTTEDVRLYPIGSRNRHLCRACYEKHDPNLETLKPRKPQKPAGGIAEKRVAVANKVRQTGGTRAL